MADLNIKHDKKKKQFYSEVEGGKAKLEYSKKDADTLDFKSTFVPEVSRNQGFASQVTEHALKYARENGYTIIPSCPFVKSYIEKHEKYQDVID